MKLMSRFIKLRVKRYLLSKSKEQFTVLDGLFKMYLSGELIGVLKNYGFIDICIFPQVAKSNYLQIDFKYNSKNINIEFGDESYDYIIYRSGISATEYESNLKKCSYGSNFILTDFLRKIQSEAKLL